MCTSLDLGEKDFDRKRAWEYHSAADTLLHSRVEALLICHAFLVVGYMQVATSSDFKLEISLQALAGGIVLLAILITFFLMRINRALLRGIEYLKIEYLVKYDDIYNNYLEKVSENYFNRGKNSKILSVWIPFVLLMFWFGVAIHVVFTMLSTSGS